MANKFFNKQTTTSRKAAKPPIKGPMGTPMSTAMGEHKDPWPGLPGKASSWPGKPSAKVIKQHPIEEGLS